MAGTYPLTLVAPTAFFTEGGASARILSEVRGFSKIGVSPTLLTYPSGRDWPGVRIVRPRRSARQMGIGFHPVRPFYDVELLRLTLSRRCPTRRPLHVYMHEGAVIGLVKGALDGSRFVLDLQGSLTEEVARTFPWISRGLAGLLSHRFEAFLEDSAAEVVVSSPGLLGRLKARGLGSGGHLHLVPDGVAVEDFTPAYEANPAKVAAWRKHYGLAPDHVVAIYVGGLSPEQGIDDLITTAPRMLRENPQIRFLVFGRPTQLNSRLRYAQLVKRLELSGKVFLPGPLPFEDLPAALSAADIGISWKKAPIEEANGKLPIYMAAGLPTVTLRTPISEYYLGLGGEGGGVLAQSIDRARESVVELSTDPELRRALGKAARKEAESALSLEGVARRLLEIHRKLD